jgi:dienelactone hydrolase
MPGHFSLLDDQGTGRESFSAGETIFVSARGLPAYEMCTFMLVRGGAGDEILARFACDRHGSLPITPLIPYFGLFDAESGYRLRLHKDAERAVDGQVFTIRVEGGPKSSIVETLAFRAGKRSCPYLFSSDRESRLSTGVELGEHPVGVTLFGFAAGCVRLFVVARQFGWREGDPIDPVRTRAGAPITVTTRIRGPEPHFVLLGPAEEFGAGSYQFIARAFPPGWYLADETVLLPGDVVSDRRFASLVVRYPFKQRFGDYNGVILTPQVAGRPLAHRPYFRFVDNFPKGTDVYAALDPDALPQGLVSQRAAIYVIQHKTAAQWNASNALNDISFPGMTSAVKIVPIVPGCVNWNTTLAWPNPQTPGAYDIAIDFGNNAANPAAFMTDGTLDPPLDMIDGYVRVGFYVTEDPSLSGPFAGSIGQHDYADGTIQVPSTDAGPTPTDSLPLTATIRYPAQYSSQDAPFAVGAFPLIVVMHGNSGMDTSYLGYNYLLDHLASWGFIAMSIYAPPGVGIETRARAILAHLAIMAQNNANPGLFQGHIDIAHIGIAGHSRGAEAVVRAARINAAEGLGWNILAGVSIAPTDYYHYGDPGIPLLVVYGANDGDVSGAWPDRTVFDIYDEAGRPRSFVFVYGATHDRFNTEWASIEATTELTWDIAPSDLPNLISLTDHENVAKGYLTAFFQALVQGRSEQMEYFSSGLKPSLTGALRIYISHQPAGALALDDFEQHNPAVNTLGGTVSGTALSTMAEDQLRTLDGHSPHVVAGGNLAWQSSAGIYLTHVPAMAQDVSSYSALSFRATQKYESPKNPAGSPQDFFVRVTDLNGKSRAIRVSTFTEIPYPYVRGYDQLVKSAMNSVRIPLASFQIANLGAQDVDLTRVASVSFEFDANVAGEIDICDIEFSG